jgi:hypothetical protein
MRNSAARRLDTILVTLFKVLIVTQEQRGKDGQIAVTAAVREAQTCAAYRVRAGIGFTLVCWPFQPFARRPKARTRKYNNRRWGSATRLSRAR